MLHATISGYQEAAPPETGAGALLRLLNVVLRHGRLILACAALGVVIAGAWLASRPRTFTSSAAFVPQRSGAGRSQLSGLAAQFGLNLGGGEDLPGYYPELVRSRELLRAVADTVLTLRSANGQMLSAPLWTWLQPKGADSAQRVESALDILLEHVRVSRDKDSGIISYSVTYPDSVLPAIIARRILAVLNDFNLRTKQGQAAAERRFIETQLVSARAALRSAEDVLQAFLQSNRAYRNSPQLQFEQERLQREVSTRQAVVTSLTQAYEQARIEEVRNTPVVTTLAAPQIPVRPDARGTVKALIIGLVLGLFLGTLIALGREFLRTARLLDPGAYSEFSEHLRLRRRVSAAGGQRPAPVAGSGAAPKL